MVVCFVLDVACFVTTAEVPDGLPFCLRVVLLVVVVVVFLTNFLTLVTLGLVLAERTVVTWDVLLVVVLVFTVALDGGGDLVLVVAATGPVCA